MPLQIVRNDITRMRTDAIVNPTNPALRPGGGADAAIHRAAGPALRDACRELVPLHPGTAGYTDAFNLPCRYIIHTAGPRFFERSREKTLRDCYRSVLSLAEELGCRTLAVPLIAAGSLGFPRMQALFIASEEIRAFLETSPMTVYLVAFDEETTELAKKQFRDVQSYIDRHYVETHADYRREAFHTDSMPMMSPYMPGEFSVPKPLAAPREERPTAVPKESAPMDASAPIGASRQEKARPAGQKASARRPAAPVISEELIRKLRKMDESFSQMLLRKIDETHMTDSQCYKKAHIDRKLFSKIRSDPQYRPSKNTVLSFAVALELPLEEAKDLLNKAGFSLSPSSKFDVIIEYFLENRIYDLFQINEALYEYDQTLLGV